MSGFVHGKQGKRQGDPLSICMRYPFFKRILFGNESHKLTLYADDISVCLTSPEKSVLN